MKDKFNKQMSIKSLFERMSANEDVISEDSGLCVWQIETDGEHGLMPSYFMIGLPGILKDRSITKMLYYESIRRDLQDIPEHLLENIVRITLIAKNVFIDADAVTQVFYLASRWGENGGNRE